jgi:hypothetical protein
MIISVESRVHRTLRSLDRFKACSALDQLPQLTDIPSPLSQSEQLIGAYENAPGQADQLLLFTNAAVHLWEKGAWRSLRYSEIANTEWVEEPKNEARTLVIRLKTDARVRLPILGGRELTRDLFTVMRFFDRVVAHIK